MILFSFKPPQVIHVPDDVISQDNVSHDAFEEKMYDLDPYAFELREINAFFGEPHPYNDSNQSQVCSAALRISGFMTNGTG